MRRARLRVRVSPRQTHTPLRSPTTPASMDVDQRLVPDAATARLLAELIKHARIDTDRDQLARFVAGRRPTDAPHGLQLLGQRIGNVRKVNLSRCTPCVRDDSPAARR